MAASFDISRGEVYLNQSVILRAGLTAQELAQTGLAFTRELDMQTGWCFRTASAQTQSGQAIQLSLGFEHDHLNRLSFGFVSDSDLGGARSTKPMSIFWCTNWVLLTARTTASQFIALRGETLRQNKTRVAGAAM
ncbi:hypothetical protein [Andreprevotia lacus]|jgi:hypothetical protein|uniref:hypothetical protein n=1 Tax=Andreprevotia lacus TaxID=1121000 RepID=UPI000A06821A|nr:hypothetical protein [Andreprevotia lacus]